MVFCMFTRGYTGYTISFHEISIIPSLKRATTVQASRAGRAPRLVPRLWWRGLLRAGPGGVGAKQQPGGADAGEAGGEAGGVVVLWWK